MRLISPSISDQGSEGQPLPPAPVFVIKERQKEMAWVKCSFRFSVFGFLLAFWVFDLQILAPHFELEKREIMGFWVIAFTENRKLKTENHL
jgi:hypothetical protein